jgi:hypothetical protein
MDRTGLEHATLLLLAIVGAVSFDGGAALMCAIAALMAGTAGVIHELRPRASRQL